MRGSGASKLARGGYVAAGTVSLQKPVIILITLPRSYWLDFKSPCGLDERRRARSPHSRLYWLGRVQLDKMSDRFMLPHSQAPGLPVSCFPLVFYRNSLEDARPCHLAV